MSGKTSLEPLVGTVIGDGKFQLKKVLGAGNFGTVFLATELLDGAAVRDAALKVFSPEASASGGVEGMLQDCALPARILSGPAPADVKRHFVQIYDFGYLPTQLGRCAFVAMELVNGARTLEDVSADYHDHGRFPRAETVLDYMRQFFTALDAAHTAGVLHRDIKGANVMVDAGVIRVMDFGMGAYLAQEDAPLKTTMSIYAPENFEGRFTAASDIYQAGLMFYQFYTGIEPFASTSSETDMSAERLRRTRFTPRPGREIPGVRHSDIVDAVLAKCLAYTEMARFGSPRAVLEAIDLSDPAAALDHALTSGDWSRALELAESALDNPDAAAEQKIAALQAAGQAHTGLGQDERALDRYREAITWAESSGALFHQPTAFNVLVDAMVAIYTARGQAGMARLTAKKRK